MYYFSVFSKISYERSPAVWTLVSSHEGSSHEAFLKFTCRVCESLPHSFLLLSYTLLRVYDTAPLSTQLLLNTLVAFSLGLL